MTIKAIETIYKGYRFRSRLEARWAVFFHALGLLWVYEKEGYDLDGLWYLPDFFLPTVGLRNSRERGLWVEVKPREYIGTAQDTAKYLALYHFTKYPLILFKGIPEHQNEQGYQFGDPHGGEGWWDNWMVFCKCYLCNYIKVEFLESNYMYCPECDWANPPRASECDDEHPDILIAIDAAKQARFEHGETP